MMEASGQNSRALFCSEPLHKCKKMADSFLCIYFVHYGQNETYCHYWILFSLFMVSGLVNWYIRWNYSHRIFTKKLFTQSYSHQHGAKEKLARATHPASGTNVHLALLCLWAPSVLAASLLLQGNRTTEGKLKSDLNHDCRHKQHFFFCSVSSSPGNWAAARN